MYEEDNKKLPAKNKRSVSRPRSLEKWVSKALKKVKISNIESIKVFILVD